MAASLLHPAVEVRRARLSSHRLEQSDESASMMVEQRAGKEKHRIKYVRSQRREVQEATW